MLAKPILGIDTETFPIEPGVLAPKLVCMTLSGVEGSTLAPVLLCKRFCPDDVVIAGSASKWRALVTRQAIHPLWDWAITSAQEKGLHIVGQNFAFDLGVLTNEYPETLPKVFGALEQGTVYDVMIREMLIAIAQGWHAFDPRPLLPKFKKGKKPSFSLAEMVRRHFDIDRAPAKKGETSWRLRFGELAGVPAVQYPEAASSYALDDASDTTDLALDQAKPLSTRLGVLVNEQGKVVNEGPQVAAHFALHLCALVGVRTDPVASEIFKVNAIENAAKAQDFGVKLGFIRPNGSRDTKLLRELVKESYRLKGVPCPMTKPKNPAKPPMVSYKRDSLQQSGNPMLADYADLTVYKTYVNTYVPQLAQGFDRPINQGYNILVRSGRISARHPNTTNPPRGGGFRECFIPRQGHVYCSVDYSIAELRALGQIQLWWFGRSALADAIRRGEDPHWSFATLLLRHRWGRHVTYAEVTAVPKKDRSHPLWEDVHGPMGARELAKRCNFGFPAGLGLDTFVERCRIYGIVIDRKTARELYEIWLQQWPEMGLYFQTMAKMTQNGPCTIEQVISKRQRGDCRYTAALNGYFQAYIADIIKEALFIVQKACWTDPSSPLYGCRPVLFVHDEIIMEIPDETLGWTRERITAAADELARIMKEVEQAWMPDIPAAADPALAYRWYKNVGEVRKNGLLYPWAPTKEAA